MNSNRALEKAVEKVEANGILLVYPIKNEKNPASLWYALYPRSKMFWDWSDDGDGRVAELWHLRTKLSESREVVYAKWFQDRATVFSREIFTAMLKLMNVPALENTLSERASGLYQLLLDDSPQSPRRLRADLDLEGKFYEKHYNQASRDLWRKLLIVGFGEVEDGAFPSLAIGATKLLFEDLWMDAEDLSVNEALKIFEAKIRPGSTFHDYFTKQHKKLSRTPP